LRFTKDKLRADPGTGSTALSYQEWNIGIPPTRPDGVALIPQWLAKCRELYPRCKSYLDPSADKLPLLPTRVVDVGNEEGTEQPVLFESKGYRSEYLTLSHCWGGSNILSTTSNNIKSFKKCVPFANVCKTLQDAITVTRRLGFRYLWIDSLCIIQDSAEDWHKESSRMADIYFHCALALSGLDSPNRNSGLLYERRPLEEDFAKLNYYNEEGMLDGHVLVSRDHDSLYSLAKFSELSQSRHSLEQRGWTLQEQVLSSRSVLFGKDQLHWECRVGNGMSVKVLLTS
jgi:hypothetical protein